MSCLSQSRKFPWQRKCVTIGLCDSNKQSYFISLIESRQNRLLKVCYMPATSARLPRLLLIFFAATTNSTYEANKAGGMRR